MKIDIKEIFRRMNDLIEHRFDKEYHTECDLFKDIQDLLDYITNLQQENERLNNIINTFEDDLEREVNISEQDSMVGNYRYTVIHSTLEKMLKYLKELKESGNNE